MARTAKEQKVLINDFMDTVFRKKSVRGVNRDEPHNYDGAMDVAKSVLTKHGHFSMGNFFNVDPYSGLRGGGSRREGRRTS